MSKTSSWGASEKPSGRKVQFVISMHGVIGKFPVVGRKIINV